MNWLTPQLQRYLLTTLKSRRPAVLVLDEHGVLCEAHGELEYYGLADLELGEPAADQLVWLSGMSLADDDTLQLPCVRYGNAAAADVLLQREGPRLRILLLATSMDHRFEPLQQFTNEIHLVAEGGVTPSQAMSGRGDRWNAIVAVASWNGRLDDDDPSNVHRRVVQFHTAIREAFGRFGAPCETRGARMVLGVFCESAGSSPRQRLDSALEQALGMTRDQPLGFGVGAGVVTVARIPKASGGQFVVYGPAADRAVRLAETAGSGELRMDDTMGPVPDLDARP